jgi:hypothetical protein
VPEARPGRDGWAGPPKQNMLPSVSAEDPIIGPIVIFWAWRMTEIEELRFLIEPHQCWQLEGQVAAKKERKHTCQLTCAHTAYVHAPPRAGIMGFGTSKRYSAQRPCIPKREVAGYVP